MTTKRKKRRGLRGTIPQHRLRAEEYLRIAEKELARGDCKDALMSASFAIAEADWLPAQGMKPGTVARRAQSLAARADACVRRRGYQPARGE